jgi:hypothetical protein
MFFPLQKAFLRDRCMVPNQSSEEIALNLMEFHEMICLSHEFLVENFIILMEAIDRLDDLLMEICAL